ncbi:UNVERIFIED_CONTAM: hypothetical protein Sradi_6813800 [Sesamum radiatum]|uniref:Plant disease resistance WDH domain-containing protein n=1 Tax=Sesamum radiatum TaxID=300843 RepID=A0AAW2JSJ0_SESRA
MDWRRKQIHPAKLPKLVVVFRDRRWVESSAEKGRTKSFEEQEEAAIARVRKELMRNIPFLVIIDNLESEKDWWDHKLVMDLLPRLGVEAISLMQGSVKDLSITEIDALRAIEEKLGRLPLGLAIVGAILSELPINPSRLLDTINRMPSRDVTWSGRENHLLRRNNFLLQLFEVCFSIFDHADGPRSLATRMVLASGWFAPAPIPIPILALAAHKIPEKHQHRVMERIMYSLTCGFTSSYARRSEAEASSLLLRFNMARSCTKDGLIQFNHIVKLYARKRGITGLAQSMVQAVISRGSISHHSDHIWAACFLLLGFGKDPIVVELKVSELLFLVKEVILPSPYGHLSPSPVALLLWSCFGCELALARATVLEVRAKLMARGGQYDIGDDLIRKAIFIRTSICGEDHPDTVTARETLSKLTRLIASVQTHTSP